jgi:arylsulfatase A-like enzyme
MPIIAHWSLSAALACLRVETLEEHRKVRRFGCLLAPHHIKPIFVPISRNGGAVIRWDIRIAVLIFCLVGIDACCHAKPEPRPDIILITIDTLRKDHVSSYGYARRTSPFLDDLAATGVRFENGYSTSCWTVPAIASLMTSLHPDSHGVVNGTVSQGKVSGQQVLPEEHVRLPELLKNAGYKAFGITANGHLASDLGYAWGFDRYENLGFKAVADDINRLVEKWKGELTLGSPYFLWLHYFDPHAPYRRHEPWLSGFASGEPVEEPGRLIVRNAMQYKALGVKKDSKDFDYILALYDGEIAYTDEAIRKTVQMLDPTSDSLIIVTSDHGEEFLDHQKFGHHDTLYEELISIPLIMRLPGSRYAGRVVDGQVSIVDIVPSLLDYLGADVPEQLQGESFMPLVEGQHREIPRPIVSSLHRYEGRRIDAIVKEEWKFIRYTGRRLHEVLYNLAADPEERTDVAKLNQSIKVKLAAALQEQLNRNSVGSEPAVAGATDERLEDLRALGYVE